jgi:hypothetical protein
MSTCPEPLQQLLVARTSCITQYSSFTPRGTNFASDDDFRIFNELQRRRLVHLAPAPAWVSARICEKYFHRSIYLSLYVSLSLSLSLTEIPFSAAPRAGHAIYASCACCTLGPFLPKRLFFSTMHFRAARVCCLSTEQQKSRPPSIFSSSSVSCGSLLGVAWPLFRAYRSLGNDQNRKNPIFFKLQRAESSVISWCPSSKSEK